MALRKDPLASEARERDPGAPAIGRPHLFPRQISVTWASITSFTILPGELVFNDADKTLVYRIDHDTIQRFDSDATRTV